MRQIIRLFLLAFPLLAVSLAYGATADHAGIVKSMVGKVVIVRSGGTFPAQLNLKLYQGDAIQTGSNGKVGLILEDDTVISMGPNSRLTIENFMFEPDDKRLSFVVSIFKGTVSFVCGQINRLAPDRMQIKTPHATVGVRGTHILIQVD